MKVLIIAPALFDTSPGQRFRFEQWMPFLEQRGITFDFAPFEDEMLHDVIYQRGRHPEKAWHILRAFRRRLRLLKDVKKYDVVFIHREAALLGPAWIEERIARMDVPIVYDFDDAIFTPYVSPANHYLSYLKCFGKTAKICALSAHVTVGNAYLRDYALCYNSNVTIIPTTIDTDKYTVRNGHADNGQPVIGWSGSYSTVQHLDTLRGALVKLHQHQPFQLRVIGTPSYELPGIAVRAQRWQPQTEVEDLQQFDVGIMPLPDEDWARGKCGLKALQYMAVGVPAVCSPVGVNCDIIQDGQNGFLAATEEEWVEKLSLLVKDKNLWQRLRQTGRRTVEEHYSAQVQAPQLLKVLHETVA
jgi:glycosyltransferase involved in cell wall biosynthesis